MLQSKWWLLGLSVACLSVACGSDDSDNGDGSGISGSGANGGSNASSGSGANTGSGGSGANSGNGASGGTIGLGGDFGAGGSAASGGSGASCSADFAKADLQPVYLAFAFDVSGSMGQGDFEWHDKTLKWDPVVAATKAFFADESSSGIQASLTFFPAESQKCESDAYATPDVPMTALPSPAFAEAIDAVTPETPDDWRGGTPTLAVTTATLGFLEGLMEDDPSAKYVYVLVSDGYPQGCDDDDDIGQVADAVADVAETIPTYVIGVANPPIDGAPDVVTNLNDIAEAGGTDEAFIIETGNAEETSAKFKEVIDSIREQAVSCQAEIPENPGGAPFDKGKVNVSVTKDGDTMNLGYDADCEGENAWRYDDEDEPTAIVLCPETCQEMQGDSGVDLSVAFGCETVPAVPK